MFSWAYLHVDVSSVVDQQLQAERSVRRGSSKVQRGEALVVGLADVGAVINQLVGDGVLSVETGQMERRVPKRVGLVYLLSEKTRAVVTDEQRFILQEQDNE